VIVYESALSGGDIASVEGYLNSKWLGAAPVGANSGFLAFC
jgi:hypothetical protein